MEIHSSGKTTKADYLLNFGNDVNRYYRYYGFDGFNGIGFIRYLPLNKGYDEHPYWLITKMEYILSIINDIRIKKSKEKKGS